MLFKHKYLSEKALLGLKNYTYKSGDYSIMDKVMTPFWNKAVEILPMWMAPNLVTLIGFSAIVAAACQYLPYDLSLTKGFEPWCYALSALSIFIY